MRRGDEYRLLTNSVRKRVGDEESAVMSAVGNFGGSAKNPRPKKIDDTGTYDELNF